MQPISPTSLPKPILDHIASYNRHDIEAFMSTFAADALVNDVQREFLGAASIRAFAEREIFGPRVTLDLAEAFEQLGNWVVRFRVDGEYDKTNLPDPLILTFYFSVAEGRIGQLLILHNKVSA